MIQNRKKILIVDDEPANRLILKETLKQNYELFFANDGYKAIEITEQILPDLILLDVMMPGMNGFEVAKKIRENSRTRLIPIILVTALTEKEHRILGIEAGCDDFISKPIDKLEVLARVKSLLKVKAYNDLMSNYRKELETEVTRRTEELEQAR